MFKLVLIFKGEIKMYVKIANTIEFCTAKCEKNLDFMLLYYCSYKINWEKQ